MRRDVCVCQLGKTCHANARIVHDVLLWKISQGLDGRDVDSAVFDADSCRKRWTLLDYDEYEQRKLMARKLVVLKTVGMYFMLPTRALMVMAGGKLRQAGRR